MKRFSEQFKKKSDNIRLRASERSDLHDRLASYMEYHPLPAEMKTASTKAPTRKQMEEIISEPFKAISINMTYVRSFAGVFAVFMVVGVPVVAERAVPGDMLYAVKTEITEELRSSIKLSPYAKVEWETKRLERRVSEARLLASEGKLTAETQAVVAEAVKAHTLAVNEEIATIRETDEDDAAIAEISFASALSVQSDVLEGHIANEDGVVNVNNEGHSIVALADVVKIAKGEADTAQADAAPSYSALLARVETETTRAYELFTSVQARADAEEIVDMERRLEDVERKLAGAISLQGSDYVHEELIAPEESEVIPDTPVGATDEEATSVVEEVVSEGEVGTSTEELKETEDSVADESGGVESVVEESSEPSDEGEVEMITQEQRATEAISLLRLALTDVQKLIIFMTDINVRESVTIEELVPVTITQEERAKSILDQLDTVLLMQVDIEAHIVSEELLEKVTIGKGILSTKLEAVSSALKVGNLESAELAVEVAHDIAKDLQKLVSELPLTGDSDVVAEAVPEEEIIETDVEAEEATEESTDAEEILKVLDEEV